jgi:hypothetical protein
MLQLKPKGIFLLEGDTQATTYRGYFSPVWDGGKFKLLCRMPGCGKMHAYMEVGKKTVFPFANAHAHLMLCKGNPILTEKDSTTKHLPAPTTSSSSSSSSSSAAFSSSGVKRPRIEGPEDHLDALGLDKEKLRMALILSKVCDGRPLSVSSLGQQYLLNVLKLPTAGLSERQLKRTFDREYESLVLNPARAAIKAFTAPIKLAIGGYTYFLAHTMQVGADGWKGHAPDGHAEARRQRLPERDAGAPCHGAHCQGLL